MGAPELTSEELDFLRGMFDLAREGRTDELAEHLDSGLPVNLTNSAGDTLLVLAAYHRRPGTVSMLLARGADHSRVNDRGQTALGAAVFRQDPAGVRALLAAGADPGAGGRSARQVAAFFGLPEMARLLDGEPDRAADVGPDDA
ncbi:MAG TPA: ankyrin repeat domain-containing protein [Dermatophilaceae bacterium]|nr:ankyrin repeat domain-containing protein [Dermatophilaceae bacterium]